MNMTYRIPTFYIRDCPQETVALVAAEDLHLEPGADGDIRDLDGLLLATGNESGAIDRNPLPVVPQLDLALEHPDCVQSPGAEAQY